MNLTVKALTGTMADDRAGMMRSLVSGVVMAIVITACGPSLVRGESPFVQVSAWHVDGDRLAMELRLRNVNDVSLDITGIRLKVSSQDTPMVDHDGPLKTSVIANGFENITVEARATAAGLRLLQQLQDGQLQSLPFDLTGEIRLAEDKPLSIRRTGHIYTVPGRPGHFR